jgi:hypothetical protein
MGRREIFNSSSLLVEVKGNFTHEFVTYVYETQFFISTECFSTNKARVVTWLLDQSEKELSLNHL